MTFFLRLTAATLLVLLPAGSASARQQQQPATITGTVTTTAGIPLSQASILIQSMGLSTVSRSDGKYTLVVPANRAFGQEVVLTARLLGHSPMNVRVRLAGGAISQDFKLEPNPFQLGEVVVTGAGTEAEFRQLGTERKSIDSAAILRTNEKNIVQALAGKLAGVVVTQSSGEAASNSRIQIRGIRSLSGGSQPLIVVDGLPVNNSTATSASPNSGQLGGTTAPNRASDISPDDIESLEVMSGASAAAIYGSGAGNGVILITTKKGRAGRTSFSYRSTYQSEKPSGSLPLQQSFGVGTGGVTPTCVAGGPANCFLSAGFFSWGGALANGAEVYDHASEIYETGSSWDNALTVSGGNDRTTFLLSAGFIDQDGFITGDKDWFNRTNVRLNGKHWVNDKLNVAANASYVQTSGNFIPRGNSINGLLLGALRTPPNFNNQQYLTEAGLHRSWRFPNPTPGAERTSRGFDNPFYALYVNLNEQRTARYFGNVAAEWLALPWLRVNYTLGADYNSEDRMEARGPASSGAPPSQGSVVARWQFDQSILDHNLTATASFTVNTDVNGSLLVGQQLNQQTFRQVRAQGNILVADDPYRIDNTVSASPPTDQETKTRLEGYFAQGKLNLWDQLFLVGTIRNDGSSTFGTETNRAWYPQGSVAWNFTEAFLKGSLLSFGKVRAAYGQTGIIPGPYQLQNVFLGGANRFSDFNPGSQTLPSLAGNGGLYTAGGKGNPGLKPERVGEFSAGADLSFWRGNIDLVYTYYKSKSEDVILGFPLAPSTGFTAQVRNSASIENKGHEVQLNVRPLTTRNVAVDFGLTWGQNQNEVLDLGLLPDGTPVEFIFWQTSFAGRTVNAQVGYPLGVIRGQDFARCGNGLTNARVAGIEEACAGAAKGALFIGANGFPVADPTERPLGDPNPDWTGGIRAGLTLFQRLNITGFLDVRHGGIVQNMTRASMYSYGTHKDTELRGQQVTFGKEILPQEKVLVGPGAGNAVTIGEAWFNGAGGIAGPVSQFNEDASYTRLRELSVSYLFDQPWVNRILGLRSIDLRVAGRNLVTWTNYTGFDPETGLGGLAGATASSQGFDWFNNPIAKAVVLSVGLNW